MSCNVLYVCKLKEFVAFPSPFPKMPPPWDAKSERESDLHLPTSQFELDRMEINN